MKVSLRREGDKCGRREGMREGKGKSREGVRELNSRNACLHLRQKAI
jgi:hypothetical protein